MSSPDTWSRLAPFIREYIYRQGWTELRAVQVAAADVLFDSDQHLLLASGTASGKTEAAFLPLLTMLLEDPPQSLGVLYIGPTKALINDQFFRLQGLLEEAEIPVWHWHGDVGRSQKLKLRQHPRGILQITPESLESLLINHGGLLISLFHDLRFVVIDEVHVFMGSDRGQQIICQLNRLNATWQREPRRVGLSATLGDYALAESWLAAGSQRAVVTPRVQAAGQRLRLSLEHFTRLPKNERQNDGSGDLVNDPYYQYIWQQTKAKKTLIFANNRGETEAVITALRQIAGAEHLPDIYHVHHGSISAPLREAAEEAMRDSHQAAVTAATVTLELGIDLGELETVIQLDAPPTVSSFLQRLGRSGRRGGPTEMRLVSSEEVNETQSAPVQLPWQLLQAIAVIELYLQEKWIEPIEAPRLPLSLLYHQTMSVLLAAGELQPQQLAKRILTLPAFSRVNSNDYRQLLLHLLDIDHLQRLEGGELLVGLAGERVVRNWRFYAVFRDTDEYLVRDENRDIGRISSPPTAGDRIALAGRTWEVLEVDGPKRLVLVKIVSGRAAISWPGSGAPIHSRVMQQIRQVLASQTDYRYLQPNAKLRLQEARRWAAEANLAGRHAIQIGGNLCAVFPWVGTRAFRALERCLRFFSDDLGVRGFSGLAPYYLLVHTDNCDAASLEHGLAALMPRVYSGTQLLGEREAPQLAKYDEFIPVDLLRKAFVEDQLAVSELRATVQRW